MPELERDAVNFGFPPNGRLRPIRPRIDERPLRQIVFDSVLF